MRSPQICIRVRNETYREILLLAKANGQTASEIARLLIEDALIMRAARTTDCQFDLVRKRLEIMENRFTAWIIKLTSPCLKSLFFTEQLALYEVDEEDVNRLQRHAEIFVQRFLQEELDKDDERAA